MESPEGDRIKVLSSSTPASTPIVSESPFFDFLDNLSPIKSVKAVRYAQRLSETHFPTPPPVFGTPHLDLQRETSFLKSDKIDVRGQCGNRSNTMLVPCKQVQSCSPSGCVEEYLTDPMEAEDGKNSDDSGLEQANNVQRLLQCSFTGPNQALSKVNDASDGNLKHVMHGLPDQAKDLPTSSLDLVETAVVQRDAERFDGSQEFSSKNVNDQNADDQFNQQSTSCQMPKYFKNVKFYKDCVESSGSASEGSSKEATLQPRGIRRHLQFEAAMTCKNTATVKSQNSHNSTEEVDNSDLSDRLAHLESVITSHVEPGGVSNHRRSTSPDQSQTIATWTSFCPSEFIRSTQHGGNFATSGPVPSCNGLHLNSISRSVPMGSDMILSEDLAGYMISQEEKLTPGHSNNLAKNLNSCFISSGAGELVALDDDNQQDNQCFREISSNVFHYTDYVKPPCNYMHDALPEQQTAPSEGRMLTSEIIDRAEELNQVSPKRRRKKAALSSESEGCKRCNCRRSKCLKLYCECFAAGVYCVDSCACESCYNKPEYEDTVLDTRQQIESRNPLAFAPKIVKQATDSPANVPEDGNWKTPASARHKRGCNCKKSKCLKKYCECYQAKVGCSDACRCEGCNNSFGKKAESMYQRAERWRNPSHCKLDNAETDNDRNNAGIVKQFSPRWEEVADLSHTTPLSQSYSAAVAPSVSPSARDYSKDSQAQWHPESSLKSSSSHLRWRYSPRNFTPQVFENKDAHELSSGNAFTDMKKDDDDIPEILKNASTPTKTIKGCSPNKKRVSPPKSQSQQLMSSSSPGLQSSRKFIWQAVPSFPPLTPYSKSKEGISQMESDINRDTSDH